MTEMRKPKLPFYKDVDGIPMPGFFSEQACRSSLQYRPRDDDLFIVSYPRCGSNWVQHIVSLIFRKGKPFASDLEYKIHCPSAIMTGAEAAETMPRPGAIKYHLPFYLMPWSTKAKYIFVARNPKDSCVSFYHYTVNTLGFDFEDGEFSDFFELFMEGKMVGGDYFDTVLSWYEHRNDANVLFVTYEDLQKDIRNNVFKMAKFMGQKYEDALVNDEKIFNDVIYHSSFEYMKKNMNRQIAEVSLLPKEAILNYPGLSEGLKFILTAPKRAFQTDPSKVSFVRKGVVRDWENLLSAEQSKRIDDKFKEKMKETDLAHLWKECM